ncbi:hypothetical protein TWF694_003530 [Orbilia ellipsospora]|uniref:Superoxide dismutase copper/zinc binding domain-containing protein n=1 Tax=Orbilia ellipsospora TaxID=2528407 RepID=A0AAV9WZQ1_9PEZI
MHFSTSSVLAAVAAGASTVSALTGSLGDAPKTTGNPTDVVYEAKFSSAQVKSAYLNFTGAPDGNGVLVHVCVSGVNASTPGPYPYHIHDFVVGSGENCTATGAHLDPYLRNDTVACDSTAPQTCQVGDLSGKHGDLPAEAALDTPYCTSYTDDFLSLDASNKAFIGNARSIVVHNINKVRLACGDLTMVSGSASVAGAGSSTPSTSPTTSSTPAVSTGGAAVIGVSSLALTIVVGAAAMLF